MKEQSEHQNFLWQLGFDTIKELETAQGILASGREEIYGCIFGRDSLVTALRLLQIYKTNPDPYFLSLVKKILENLFLLQGKTINIESGEEPGKCIHEFRPVNHEHLTTLAEKPWYLYEDKTLRNFDSVDATPLLLIACYRYFQLSEDTGFLQKHLPQIKLSLSWILEYGDTNHDGFIDFGLHPARKYGGLISQNWMDSAESLFHEDGTKVTFPIASVEVQGYAFLALKLWSNHFVEQDINLSKTLSDKAQTLKKLFSEAFILPEGWLASGIDGSGKPLTAVRSSMGHCLWAALNSEQDAKLECIIKDENISAVVSRLMQPDLFEPTAGIRTLSSNSLCYDPNSYHNGSIWPHDSSLIAEGLQNFGFSAQANAVRKALLRAWGHFGTPIELFVYKDGDFHDYKSRNGQVSCKKQAWSAASLLSDASLVFEN